MRRERDASARRAAFEEILTELTNTVTRNGARGFQRSLQALQAALSVGNEYVANFRQGVQDPPQVLLTSQLASKEQLASHSVIEHWQHGKATCMHGKIRRLEISGRNA